MARPSLDLQNWANTFALTDAWRHFHPHDREYTCDSTSYRALSRIDLVYVSSGALRCTRERKHLPRGISDHAPLNLTISLARSPGLKLWRLSRFWVLDERIQESILEAICNFWLLNGDSANATTLWDTFKAWIRGEYVFHISSLQREATRSLEVLEWEAGRCEAVFIESPNITNHLTWQRALRELSFYNVEQTNLCYIPRRGYLNMVIKMDDFWLGWRGVK